MKNLQSFEEFVNEGLDNLVTEMKTLSPANVKKYELNKNSIKALKNWSYKIEDLYFKFIDVDEYWNKNYDPTFIEFLKGTSNYSDYINFDINGEKFEILISYDDKFSPGFNVSSRNATTIGIKYSEYLIYIGEVEDKIDGFVKLLDYVFKKYGKDIAKYYKPKLNLPNLYVIPVGGIAPATGKTPHGWSIFDNPTAVLGILSNGSAVINASGMKIGDKYKLMDDQKRKEISKEVEIVDLVPCNYDEFLKYSRSVGAEVPIRAFKKQPGKFRIYLYAIK